MPVYRLTADAIEPLPETTFAQAKLKERGDLQRILRANIGVVAEGVLVISEEFGGGGEWEDSRRRIDLLGVDEAGNLVVVELKRDDDGSHMELQAVRYAAMVSGMTFARAVEVFQAYLDRLAAQAAAGAAAIAVPQGVKAAADDADRADQTAEAARRAVASTNGALRAPEPSPAPTRVDPRPSSSSSPPLPSKDAQSILLDHLGWDAPREDDFAQDVRIVLVSGDFSKEITTAVLWLNERDLDIRCVRLKPYVNPSCPGEFVVEAQQVIPLPEAAEYTVQLRQKEQAARKEKAERSGLWPEFWKGLLAKAAAKTPAFAQIAPGTASWIGASAGVPGLRWNYQSWKKYSGVELYIDHEGKGAAWNKAVYDELAKRKPEIEAAYGAELVWYRLDDKRASRIMEESILGTAHGPRETWPAVHDAMVAAMVRLEKAIGPSIAAAAKAADAALVSPAPASV